MSLPERQIAVKCTLADIQRGTFVKGEGLEPSFVQTPYGAIARANVLGVLITSAHDQATLDDGTATISLRFFNNPRLLERCNPGDPVLCVAKIREFNGERYLLPEILKPIHEPKWIQVRRLELQSREPHARPVQQAPRLADLPRKPSKTKQMLLDKVKELDQGEGVQISKVIQSSDEQRLLDELILEGDIFELRPGIVKSLE